MNNRALHRRVCQLEACVARVECVELDRVVDALFDSIRRVTDERLAADDASFRVRTAFDEILWDDAGWEATKRRYSTRTPIGKAARPMSRRRIGAGLSFAGMTRDDLIQHLVDPLLEVLGQALEREVQNPELRKAVETEARTDLTRIVDKARPQGGSRGERD